MSIMKSAQPVYYGPNASTYEQAGNVSSGEKIMIVWKEGDWCYIQYAVDGTVYHKRGYVPMSTITIDETYVTLTPSYATRYVINACPVYYGPHPSVYQENDTLDYTKQVSYLGKKDYGDQYAFIEYAAEGTAKHRRAWILAANLAVSAPSYKTFKENDIIPAGLPLAGAEVTQGWNDKSTNHKGHLGYDMVGFSNVTPLFDGTVVSTQTTTGKANGRTVCVQHTVNGVVFYTSYCHLASVVVSTGDSVTTGTTLGSMGGSGYGSETYYGTHLHVCAYTGASTNNPVGYCGNGYETFEDVTEYANDFYYGPDTTKFPNCYSRCYYDPYGVVTSNAEIINQYP